jgi:putative ABC transport system substrate-binding protein
MNQRRKLVLWLAAAGFALPRLAWPQMPGRKYRLGWISQTDSFKEPYALAFVARLAELGFVEGHNLMIERRHANGIVGRLPAVAAELGKSKFDAYFGGGSEANLAALTRASRDGQIAFVAVDFDPIATGDVASLARPAGRVTGVTALQSELPAKRLELLKELLPGIDKAAVFSNEQTTGQLALSQGTARRLGVTLHVVELNAPFDFEAGFADAARAKADAVLVLGSGLWVPARRLIPALALKARLPSVFHQAQWVEAGGLMSYGFNFVTMWRRAAEMTANLLLGAKASSIPMEQPTVFELVLNNKTAKAIGLKIPQSLLVRADRMIE